MRSASSVAAKAASVATLGAGATAAVVIGGLAVGLAIGTALRKLFGEARVIRAEEAAVEGALVLRRARAALQDELGRALTQPEVRKMFTAYEANLMSLGFEQQANGQWHRPRSAVERFLG